jgi:hypothetical protein
MTSRSSPAGRSSESAISDQMLSELSHLERADLLRRVQMLHASEFSISQRMLTARRWFIRFLAVCCLVLIPWTASQAARVLPRSPGALGISRASAYRHLGAESHAG